MFPRRTNQTYAVVSVRSVLIFDQAFARLKIRLHHFLDERVKIDIAFPAEYLLGFGRPSQKLPTHVTLSAIRRDKEMGSTLTRLRTDGSTWDRFEPEFVRFQHLSPPLQRPFPTIYGGQQHLDETCG
jgi:hypothetical protein